MNFRFLTALFIIGLSACSTEHVLVDTPNLYAHTNYPEETLPSIFKTVMPDIFYITDRQPEADLHYGSQRSASMAFGKAQIVFGENLTWKELSEVSSTQGRKKEVFLKLSGTEEILRFPETPLPFSVLDGVIMPQPEAQEAYYRAIHRTKAMLQDRLLASQDRDIILFVHGFNNDFKDSALAMAEIWHFTGRKGVPVFYTWPAASGGLLGYFVDRESGEFSIYHLKETLRILADTPGAERIHIIAHSRGTDITTTALRELVIEARAAGKDPRQVLKVENLILAAPDLDFGVVRQRLIAEKFGPAFGQITVYMNQGDEALGFSQYLMSGLRFGRLAKKDLNKNDEQILKHIKNVHFINVEGVNSFIGHGYYREHPGVLSDIAITIRNRLKPGELGRPLIHEQINFWTLPKNYPANN